MAWPELQITADLSAALSWVLGDAPSTPAPVVVVAACLDLLAKGYGLSESGHIDWDPLVHAGRLGGWRFAVRGRREDRIRGFSFRSGGGAGWGQGLGGGQVGNRGGGQP